MESPSGSAVRVQRCKTWLRAVASADLPRTSGNPRIVARTGNSNRAGIVRRASRELRKNSPRLSSMNPTARKSLALTAFAREQDRTRAIQNGFTTHIGKPVNPEALVSAVANLAAVANRY